MKPGAGTLRRRQEGIMEKEPASISKKVEEFLQVFRKIFTHEL
jgi:hypothetical protein